MTRSTRLCCAAPVSLFKGTARLGGIVVSVGCGPGVNKLFFAIDTIKFHYLFAGTV
jgi:hypothetical protein